MTQISPRVVENKGRYIRLLAPSKSTPEAPRTIQYYPSGKHHCDCPGWTWFRRKGMAHKLCRHAKMTTMQTVFSDPRSDLEHALKLVEDKTAALPVTWGFVACQFPENRRPGAVTCGGCPLYPKVCSIHPLRFGSGCKNNRKPLIWKVQTAVYNGRRKKARLLLRKFSRAVAAARTPCSSCGGRGYIGDGVECHCHPNRR